MRAIVYVSRVIMSIKPGPAVLWSSTCPPVRSWNERLQTAIKMQSTVDKPPGVGFPHPKPTLSFWLQGTRNDPLIGHRTTDTIPNNSDVVIIGAGMSGAATAYHLFKGHEHTRENLPSVVVLEAREACYGATGRNGGHCKPDFYKGAFFALLTGPHL